MNILSRNIHRIMKTFLSVAVITAVYLMLKKCFNAALDKRTLYLSLALFAIVAILKILSYKKRTIKVLVDIFTVFLALAFSLYIFRDLFELLFTPVLNNGVAISDFETFIKPLYTENLKNYIDRLVLVPITVFVCIFFRSIFIKDRPIVLAIGPMIAIAIIIYFKQIVIYKYYAFIFILLIMLFYISGFKENKDFRKTAVVYIAFAMILLASYLLRNLTRDLSKPEWIKTMGDYEVFKYKNQVEEVVHENEDIFTYLFDSTLGKIDNSRFDAAGANKVFKYESTYPIDRFIAYRFYDYNFADSSFLIKDLRSREGVNQNTISSISQNSRFYNRALNQHLSLNEEKYVDHVEVTNLAENNFVYIPYGDLMIRYPERIEAYEDKGIVTSYLSSFNDTSYEIYIDNKEDYSRYENEYSVYTITKTYYKDIDMTFESSSEEVNEAINEFVVDYAKYDYLQVPQEMMGLLDFLKEKKINPDNENKKETISQIRNLLDKEYRYRNNPGTLPQGEDPVMYFLLKSKQGYSKHFAAAETILYRLCNIPARYVFGYETGNKQNSIITEADGRAWCEVFVENNWSPSDKIRTFEEKEDEFIYLNSTEEHASTENTNESPLDQYKGAAFDFYSTRSFDKIVSRTINSYVDHKTDDERLYGINDLSEYYYDLLTTDNVDDYYEIFSPSIDVYPNYRLNKFSGMCKEDNTVSFLNFSNNRTTVGFKPGATVGVDENYSKYVNANYMYVPEYLKNQLENYLIEHNINKDEKDKTKLINQILTVFYNEITYTLDADHLAPSVDPVIGFLYITKAGKCEEFSDAAVPLFRVCGIPTRKVEGYNGPFPKDKKFTVDTGSAHAWTQVYVENVGWVDVDVTVGKPDREYRFPSYDGVDVNDLDQKTSLDIKVETALDNLKSDETEIEEQNDIVDNQNTVEFIKEEESSNNQGDSESIETVKILDNLYENLKKYLPLLIKVFIAGLLILIVVIMIRNGVFVPFYPSLLQKINNFYRTLDMNNYVDKQTYDVMERIRYSTIKENNEDLELIRSKYKQMNIDLKNNKKTTKIITTKITHIIYSSICFVMNIIKSYSD